ncbi:hypothetical protein WICPIJ_002430 [Wickerhamomyces pijperi]|uniref:Lipoyl-binding domain-containing protein n=1 Tax=Wickerhamomyces pijperi TaxID=599730 RepID=A0A9P8TQ65_WICPI|nr:hypothetical protein WICPIJ_002430 [Wickerhamomyces pijperi]
MLYTARYLVLGLGDVFLGAPCAVPLDPRHRLLGSKYNPSRTYTANGVVGIGGMYMCIYAMDSPGGYQLVGRTIPIWDKLKLGAHSVEHPWLLTPFDQVEFYPVSEEELDKFTEDCKHGSFKVDFEESVFDHEEYLRWIEKNKESIDNFEKNQKGEKAAEFAQLIQVANEELSASGANDQGSAEEYPEGAELIYSEYNGRFWKPLVAVGDVVTAGQGLVVVEAMKTEMIVSSTKAGKVLKIIHKNGDMVESGDLVARPEIPENQINREISDDMKNFIRKSNSVRASVLFGDDHMKLVSQTLNSCLRIDVAHTRANHFGVRPELGITYIVVGTDFDNDIVLYCGFGLRCDNSACPEKERQKVEFLIKRPPYRNLQIPPTSHGGQAQIESGHKYNFQDQCSI